MSLRFLGELSLTWGGILGVIVAGLVGWWYRRELRDQPGWLRWTLPGLRATAVLLAILTLCGPVLRRSRTIGELGTVHFCIDTSASMERSGEDFAAGRQQAIAVVQGWLPEAARASIAAVDAPPRGPAMQDAAAQVRESSRRDRAERLLVRPRGWLEELKPTHRLEVYGFSGDDAVPWWRWQQDAEIPESFPALPAAAQTNLSDPLGRALGMDDGADAAVAGSGATRSDEAASEAATEESAPVQTAVVLMSDGRHNRGPSPLEVATRLAERGVALYCVGFGSTDEPLDLAVLELRHPETVGARDRVQGVLRWKDRGAVGGALRAVIRVGEEVVWERSLVSQGLGVRETEFSFPLEEVVEGLQQDQPAAIERQSLPVVMTAELESRDEEASQQNNRLESRLLATVRSQRVMLLDGRSRWETRYLRNLFQRDEAWQINTLVGGAAAERTTLPRGEGDDQFPVEISRLDDYDLIFLGEIEPGLLRPEEQQGIVDYVARGGGLVIVDGNRDAWRELSGSPLGVLLPVDRQRAAEQKVERLQLTMAGREEAALRLVDDAMENKTLWQQLPPPHGMWASEPRPGAEVLAVGMVGDEPQPAIVRRPFGGGQVLYFAFDESWRWRYRVADRFHLRFWNQVARATMRAPFSASDSFASLDTGLAQYSVGQTVPIRARLRQANGEPIEDAMVDAVLSRGDEVVATVGLKADPGQAGMYRGRTETLPPGVYTTRLRASGFSESALQVQSEFRIAPSPSAELDALACHEALLRELAVASGGAYLHESEADRLLERLRPLSAGRIETSDWLLWRSYVWFFLILGLLAVEWLLRKRAGLL